MTQVPGSGAVKSPLTVHRGRMFNVGLVGGIGSGKSTVAQILEELGCFVSRSDQTAHELLARTDIKAQLVSWWGKEILARDGQIDRQRVGAIVFNRPEERTRLQELLHPLIHEVRAQQRELARQRGHKIFVIDAPLLFEAGLDKECESVLFVDSPRSSRLTRVAASRGWSEHELDRREGAQLPINEKRARSSNVVINDADLATLRKRVEAWFELISQQLAGSGR
jgi:dephospho-CoA kinase